MNRKLLPAAIAAACAQNKGLSKIILPRGLPSDFKADLAAALEDLGGIPVRLGPGAGELSLGEAISYRTPEGDKTSKAILLIATDGDVRELKSLETFRDVLVGGLPGGLGADEQAILQASSVADYAAEILKDCFDHLRPVEMAKALHTMFSYLASAYREAGNDEKRWTEAFWLHLDMLCDALELGLDNFPKDLPNREAMVVFASAGLPRPKSKDGFATNHKPSDFVKVVRDGWSEIEDIELSLLGVQERDEAGEDHLLAKLDWSGFLASRTSLGHGLLALAFHAHQHDLKRIDAWAATSEASFFDQSKKDEVAYQFWSLDNGEEMEVPRLEWRGVDHVLPPVVPRRRDDGTVLLGHYKLRLEIDPGANPGAKIDCKPASACSATVMECTAIDGAMELEFELCRKVAKKGGKWREKPFTLFVSPLRTSLDSQFRETFELKLCAPNPVTPSVMAIERNGKGKALAPSYTADSFVAVGSDGQLAEPANAPDRDLTLSDKGGPAELVIIGNVKDPKWIGGANLKPVEGASTDYIHHYELTGQPADPVVEVGSGTVSIVVPLVENGQVNPFLAAFMGEPVIAASEDVAEEMARDPRGDLEKWLSEGAIVDTPDDDFCACLGTCLVEVSRRASEVKLRWDDGLGAFTNTGGAKSVTFPSGIATSEAGDRFWRTFLDLGLGNEPVIGQQSVRALPSTLDLRSIARDKVEAYLEAYGAILDLAKGDRASSWAAYPFSALLYDSLVGVAKGVLLSPLHPVRLAWSWSVQAAGVDINDDPVFSKVSRSFLRFVDGEMFPEAGPATDMGKTWVSTGLAPGPHEMFVGWSMLSGLPLEAANQAQSLKLLGLDLPFGTPSGLDQGGVSSALRDYLRVFPASQHLRIGLAASRGGKRFEETDDAIIAASVNLLGERDGQLPGGIRIVDSSERKGAPPSSSRVLARLQDVGDSRDGGSLPPFEWTTEDASSPDQHHVDLQFVEDSVVTVHTGVALSQEQAICTAGPGLPVNRFRSWQLNRAKDSLSSFGLGIEGSSFAGLAGFTSALTKLEALQVEGDACRLEARLQLGHRMLGDNAKWTITGNRNLSPAVLSEQLRKSRADVALWEWRPAFLSRQRQKSAISAISSTHPYTVLAKPSGTLTSEIKKVLGQCGVHNEDDDVAKVITSLGMRGVGLSSLLTMGHTQSLGAIGFNLAFRGLDKWESSAAPGEIRSVVPMDSVYPLLDLLGEGARTPDDQRRADLLLLSTKIDDAGNCTVRMHPVEVKMRTSHSSRFPTGDKLDDPLEQLDSTFKVLEQVTKNLGASGSSVLPWAAFASFLEAAFSLRPSGASSNPALEAQILGLVAGSASWIVAERGTVLWFQVGGRTEDGEEFDLFIAERNTPGGVLIDPAAFNIPSVGERVQDAIAKVIDDALESFVGYPAQSASEDETPGASTSVEAPHDGNPPDATYPVQDDTPGNDQGSTRAEPLLGLDHVEPTPVDEPAEPSLPEQTPDVPTVTVEFDLGAGIEVLVGHYPQGSVQRPIHLKLSETSLSQMNIGVVGDLGTGKTQFLKSLVYQVANSATVNRGTLPKVFIFDYKRDYSEKEYPVALSAQVLDPAKAPLPINFFAIDADRLDGSIQMERVRRANFFSDLLRRISNIGVVQRNDLYSCVIAAYGAAPQGTYPTIKDIYEAYQGLGKNDSVISVLRMLVDLMIFESDPSQTRSFIEIFDRNTVLNLSGISGAGQDIVDIVATMFLDNLYTDYMKTREKKPFITGEDGKSRRYVDSLILIDEAHHAMGRDFDVLMKLMLEGREFGMGVILSSQYLSHFNTKGYNWAEALSTWVVHNVRYATAKQFEAIGFRLNVPDMVTEVTKLQTHWAYYRCMNNHNEGVLMKGQPFFSLGK